MPVQEKNNLSDKPPEGVINLTEGAVSLSERQEESSEIWDPNVKTVHSTPEQRLIEDWKQMKRDRDAHVTTDILLSVRENPETDEVEDILFRHLTRCSWCRNTLWESLEISRAPEDHALYLLLKDAEDWERENDTAIAARQQAEHEARENNGQLIFAQDDLLLAKQPDGSVVEIGTVRKEATSR
jgi:hypothetical protein